jgi:hypothetical protein
MVVVYSPDRLQVKQYFNIRSESLLALMFSGLSQEEMAAQQFVGHPVIVVVPVLRNHLPEALFAAGLFNILIAVATCNHNHADL